MNAEHMFVAINPKRISDTCFYDTVDEYIREIRSSEQVIADCPIAVPGDDIHIIYKENTEQGIAISEAVQMII